MNTIQFPKLKNLVGGCLAVAMGLLLAMLITCAGGATAPPTPNGELLVTTLEDELNSDGDCSLREAVEAANTNAPVDECWTGDVLTDTISFAVNGTITLTSQLSVSHGGPLVVEGGEVITLSGGEMTRLWWVESGSQLTLMNLSVVDGYINSGDGAGVYSEGRLSILHCTFYANRAADAGGCGGGAIHQQGGRLTVIGSTFLGNSAVCTSAWGGAIVNQLGTAVISDSLFSWNLSQLGGGILNFGTLTVTRSTFLGNYASHEGGAIDNYFGRLRLIDDMLFTNSAEYSGAVHNFLGTVEIEGSTFADNSAFWGGVIMNQGLLTVTNSTLSANEATDIGGGIYNTYSGTLTVTNTTLSGNWANQGGAVYAENPLTMTNSILANSPTGGDCWGEIVDGGYNLSSDDTCSLDPGNGSMPDTDAVLGALQDNGGPTWTQALLLGSPAIDAGDYAQCSPVDQRGVPRPLDGDGDGVAICDIGAYEAEPPLFSPTAVTIEGATEGMIGQTYTFSAVVEPLTTTLPLSYTWQVDDAPPITHSGGLSDTASFVWEAAGVYTITVSAMNSAGTVSNTHTISITDVPITGLAATNDSPTWLGEVTTLSATIISGTNASFTWDFGDGETGSGEVVTHSYAAAGVYTATVTASNTAGEMMGTTRVTIQARVYWQYAPLVVKRESG